MLRSPSRQGFTLIEMLTVMLIIAILAGMVLAVNGYVQNQAARTRATAEMKSIALACESFKVDNGTAPRDNSDSKTTDLLDPKVDKSPTDSKYTAASKYLYIALSGDTNADGKVTSDEGKSYAADLFAKPSILNVNKDANGKITAVNYIKDPFDNCYGYSTAGAAAEEKFVDALRTDSAATREASTKGYNSTYDLWSTGGSTSSTPTDAKWLKNW